MLTDENVSARSKLAMKLLKESKKVLSSCRDFCENFSSHPEDYIPHIANAIVSEAANGGDVDHEGGERLPQSVDAQTLQTLSDLQVAGCGDHNHNHEHSFPPPVNEVQKEHAVIPGTTIESGVA